MPGKRNTLSKPDQQCLKCFFTERDYSSDKQEFFKLNERRKSTAEIRQDVNEFVNRLKPRLERLKQFGFLSKKEDQCESRCDTYWYPTIIGLYYILTIFDDNKKRRKFLKTNNEIGHLGLIIRNNVSDIQLQILIDDMKHYIERYQYEKIMDVIKDFFDDIEKHIAIPWELELEPNTRSYRTNSVTGKREII